MMNPNKISEIHLMLFELELNHSELKNGLVQVEGRKEFLENEINFCIQNIQVTHHFHRFSRLQMISGTESSLIPKNCGSSIMYG